MNFRLNFVSYYFIHLFYPVKMWSKINYKKKNRIYNEEINKFYYMATRLGRLTAIVATIIYLCTISTGYLFGAAIIIILLPFWYFWTKFEEVTVSNSGVIKHRS